MRQSIKKIYSTISVICGPGFGIFVKNSRSKYRFWSENILFEVEIPFFGVKFQDFLQE